VQAVTRILRFTIQIVGGIKPKGGRNSQPRRWVVERIVAWTHASDASPASTSRPRRPMRP